MDDHEDDFDFIDEHLNRGDALGWFEQMYAGADGNARRVPWARMSPRGEFAEWLQIHEPDGRGKAALVVGCGLGDDAEALAAHGFAVTAFDVSPSAIQWCRERFPESTVEYLVADLFHAPAGWQHRFDFVLEIFTVQALPIVMRQQTVNAIADFVAPGGSLLVVCIGIEQGAERTGPPWPLTEEELAHFQEAGLTEVETDIWPAQQEHHARYRVRFERGTTRLEEKTQ